MKANAFNFFRIRNCEQIGAGGNDLKKIIIDSGSGSRIREKETRPNFDPTRVVDSWYLLE